MSKIQHIFPPNRDLEIYPARVFLAGTIDMGNSEDWQKRAVSYFLEHTQQQTTIFNPRRPDWNSSWEQNAAHPEFVSQVTWELDRIEQSGRILMYFAPNSMSPITLLELGLCIGDEKMRKRLVVVCPEGFWRKGNVDIVCQRYGVVQCDSIEAAANYIIFNKQLG